MPKKVKPVETTKEKDPAEVQSQAEAPAVPSHPSIPIPQEKTSSETPVLTEEDFPKISSRRAFYGLDFRELDKHLSPDEQREWNAIYASFRAGSILTGRVAGVDSIRGNDTSVDCLIVFDYRVKVVIPKSEVWAEEESEHPSHVMQRFLGAEVDYIVTHVDREGDCVVASRKQALLRRRKTFHKRPPKEGDVLDCRVLAVGSTRLLLEYGGYETTLSQNQISYGTILDLREDYRPGQIVKAVYHGLDGIKIQLSIKDVNPHPFAGVDTRHPVHCKRVSRIVGKYAGGVFCELEKGFTCLCLYSPEQQDCDFDLGDGVIIAVTRHDYENKLVYGRIVTSW